MLNSSWFLCDSSRLYGRRRTVPLVTCGGQHCANTAVLTAGYWRRRRSQSCMVRWAKAGRWILSRKHFIFRSPALLFLLSICHFYYWTGCSLFSATKAANRDSVTGNVCVCIICALPILAPVKRFLFFYFIFFSKSLRAMLVKFWCTISPSLFSLFLICSCLVLTISTWLRFMHGL